MSLSDHRTILEDHIYSNKHVTSNRKDHYNVIHTLYNSIRLNYDIETDELLNMYVKFKKKMCSTWFKTNICEAICNIYKKNFYWKSEQIKNAEKKTIFNSYYIFFMNFNSFAWIRFFEGLPELEAYPYIMVHLVWSDGIRCKSQPIGYPKGGTVCNSRSFTPSQTTFSFYPSFQMGDGYDFFKFFQGVPLGRKKLK